MNMFTACRTDAFKRLQLNAGIFLVNFDYSTATDANTLRTLVATALADDTKVLGATRGGGTFAVTQETREPEVDGKRYRFRGGTFVDSVDASLTGTLVEINPNNFKKLLATGDLATSGRKSTLTMHTAIEDGDYIDSLCWVGDMSDGGAVLIELDNALNTNGLTLTFTDKGEGTIPFEFHAHQGSVEDFDNAPFRVVFLDVVPNPGVAVSPSNTTVKVGSTVTLTATTIPGTATVTWASDDTDKATVAAGVVTGAAVGTVTITASITEGGVTYKDTAVVTVTSA